MTVESTPITGVDLVPSSKQDDLQQQRAIILPCHVKFNGPVKASMYFLEDSMQMDSATISESAFEAQFRGRHLKGEQIELSKLKLKGYIVEQESDKIRAKYPVEKVVVYEHDFEPHIAQNAALRSLKLMPQLQKAIHSAVEISKNQCNTTDVQ
ncbi:hypothetical protein MP228_007977 [Amoeboaphelidium protococcarum]|nr:hypothetical protein MP228_007977 [Amoeboaphelidium protococcarum]